MFKFLLVPIFLGVMGVLGQVQAQVVINEYLPNPAAAQDKSEWLELYNTTDAAVNLNGWKVDGQVFSEGEVISAGGYLVVTKSAAEFTNEFGIVPELIEKNITLTNTGGEIILENGTNAVDTVSYTTSVANISWERVAPDCTEFELHADSHSAGLPNSNLRESCTGATEEEVPEGSEEEATEQSLAIRISEVHANPVTGENEWVELENYGSTQINLTDWRISDLSRSQPLSGQVVAGGFLVFETTSVSLNNTGDTISITAPSGEIIDSLEYPALERGFSYSRGTEGQFAITSPTKGSINIQQVPEVPQEEEEEQPEPEAEPEPETVPDPPKSPKKYKLPVLKAIAAKVVEKVAKKEYLPVWPGYAGFGGVSLCWLCWDCGLFRKLSFK